MALCKVSLFLCLFGLSCAAYIDELHHHHHHHHPEYKFQYSVHDPHSHDVKSQAESRHGDVVKGFYTLKEADGTTREVHYTADGKTGFHAEVLRTGHAQHPEVHAVPHVAPIAHHAAAPAYFGGLGHGAPFLGGHGAAPAYLAGHGHHYAAAHGHGAAISTSNSNLFGHHF